MTYHMWPGPESASVLNIANANWPKNAKDQHRVFVSKLATKPSQVAEEFYIASLALATGDAQFRRSRRVNGSEISQKMNQKLSLPI